MDAALHAASQMASSVAVATTSQQEMISLEAGTGSAAAAASLLALPSAVLLHELANAFLGDVEARVIGATCRAMLAALKDYRIRRQLDLASVLTSFGGMTIDRVSGMVTADAEVDRWVMGRPVSVKVGTGQGPLMAHLHRLPKSVRDLTVMAADDAPSSVQLPSGLTSLTLVGFGLPLASCGELPETLQSITHPRWRVPQRLDRVVWPTALTELFWLGDSTPIATWSRLPEGLRKITFHDDFNQAIPAGWLPDSITELSFGDSFDQPLADFRFPPSLEYLEIGSEAYSHPMDLSHLPASCTRLSLPAPAVDWDSRHSYAALHLPDSVRELELGLVASNQDAESYADLRLPSSLAVLTLFSDAPLGSMRWPAGLGPMKLELHDCDHPLLPGHLPPSLTDLDLEWDLPMIELSLPAGLTSLRLKRLQPLVGELVLPAALTHLECDHWFDHSLGWVRWPRGLRSLQLCYPLRSGQAPPPSLAKITPQGGAGLPQTLTLIRLLIVQSRFDQVADAWRAIVASTLPHCRLEAREWG